MRKTAALILDRSLLVLPFTATLTVVTTVVICYLKDMREDRSANYYEKRTAPTSIYLSVGMAILFPQMLIIIIGRLRLLLETQSVINRIILYIIHTIAAYTLDWWTTSSLFRDSWWSRLVSVRCNRKTCVSLPLLRSSYYLYPLSVYT